MLAEMPESYSRELKRYVERDYEQSRGGMASFDGGQKLLSDQIVRRPYPALFDSASPALAPLSSSSSSTELTVHRPEEDSLPSPSVSASIWALNPSTSDVYFLLNKCFKLISGVSNLELSMAIVDSSLRDAPFETISIVDIEKVGRSFANHMISNLKPPVAVEEFIVEYDFATALDARCSEFRPLLLQLATAHFKKGLFGVKFRLYSGAALSIADMISDVVMIFQYFRNGNMGYVKSLIGSICANLFFQSVFVLLQNRKKSKLELFRELLYLFSGVSPGIHAYRVANGEERVSTDFFTPSLMHVCCKACDVVGECIPGLIIQLHAYLTLSKSSVFAPVSLVLSTATTSFTVVMLFYDKDTDMLCRATNPEFYGAFPDGVGARAYTLCVLMVFTMSHVFSKCFGLTILWCTFGGSLAWCAWALDLVLFCLIKIVQGDWFTWLPIDSLLVAHAGSLLFRFANKLMVDFTGFMQLRHSFEMG